MTYINQSIRVRIAPSPTGNLHIGTARTALFNWLFARQNDGVFVVRIEDTDIERSSKKYEEDIMSGLEWLGLIADESPMHKGDYGPYRQSERGEIYEKYINQLLENGSAYWCFCTKDLLEEKRRLQQKSGLSPKYDGLCRGIDIDEAIKRREAGDDAVIRIRVPDRKMSFVDLVRGVVEFDMNLLGDIVIARGVNAPLYNFAVVVDDYCMDISHIIRGEDHIANTPKQIFIAELLGFDIPVYAHLPLILGSDKSKLSKRDGEMGLMEYKKRGYLPEAILNFLVLLGWHPSEDREVISVKEMISEFDFEKVQKGGAVYDKEKLDWLNGRYIRDMDLSELAKLVREYVPEDWFENEIFMQALSLEKDRMKVLCDFKTNAGFFFETLEYDADILIWKDVDLSIIRDNLRAILDILERYDDIEECKKEIMEYADENGKGETLWPFRVALCGQKASPGPFEIMEVLGIKESARRVKEAIKILK